MKFLIMLLTMVSLTACNESSGKTEIFGPKDKQIPYADLSHAGLEGECLVEVGNQMTQQMALGKLFAGSIEEQQQMACLSYAVCDGVDGKANLFGYLSQNVEYAYTINERCVHVKKYGPGLLKDQPALYDIFKKAVDRQKNMLNNNQVVEEDTKEEASLDGCPMDKFVCEDKTFNPSEYIQLCVLNLAVEYPNADPRVGAGICNDKLISDATNIAKCYCDK